MLPQTVKRLSYDALFQSHISYCLTWEPTKTNINVLRLLQKKCTDVITNNTVDVHTEPLFQMLNI